jgi:hypothetical protein
MSDTDPMHQQLLGHLLGALDDDEQEWVESRLERDEEYRRCWVELRRRMAPLLAARPDFEPPPGLAEQTCRLVASFAPVARTSSRKFGSPRRGMSPDSAFPAAAARFCWLDVAALAMILMVVGVLVPPAIHASRFHARLASCQDGLRQVGQALSEYGYHHGNNVTEYADNERLTTAGQVVADMLDDRLAPDDGRTLCPDAWLAAQGALHLSPHIGAWSSGMERPAAELADVGPSLPTGSWMHLASSSSSDWPGTWRNGTLRGDVDPPTTAVALLSDAPSADLPGQILDCHDGQGRNRFFEDGHVDFLPCSTPRDATDVFLSRDDSPTTPRVSVPIRLTGWH